MEKAIPVDCPATPYTLVLESWLSRMLFDAMESDRPYRNRMPLDRVMGIMQEESGRQFDPVVVEALMNTIYSRAPKAA